MKQIAIIDFGSQYAHLIARRIREFNCLAVLYPDNTKLENLPPETSGVIFSGGPHSVTDKKSPQIDKAILNSSLPILGLCYGHQSLAHHLGGQVTKSQSREYGPAKLQTSKSPLFNKVKNNSIVWMSHADSATCPPKDFTIIGQTDNCKIAAMSKDDKIFGLQFHPEVEHSEYGKQILKNFVLDICKTDANWKMDDLVKNLITEIKNKCEQKNVFILVSGGVDSSVAFALLTKALSKKRVLGCYIDTGFMRHEESARIMKAYEQAGYNNLHMYDASELFFSRLHGVIEPEKKRHIIGQTFLDVKTQVSKKLKLNDKDWLLGQGTIYPDTIESGGTKHADKIKTHHNRVDAIQKLINEGKLVEPLVDFYKDEVRQIGKLLKLPTKLINRHPFPGPGLAIRCLCSDHEIKITTQEKNKVSNFVKKKYPEIKSCILPLRSVGVQGDNRSYAHPLVVWGKKNWSYLDALSSTCTNKFPELNRVILWLNPKDGEAPPFQASQKLLDLNKTRIKLLQKIDHIVMSEIKKNKLYDDIWQFPIILVPIIDKKERESIVLRPFVSQDVMTLKFARLPLSVLNNITKKILATEKISYIFYDISNKPPGTVEWE